MATAPSNGIEIEYETFGDGEPLLLIMGLGGQLVMWPTGFIDLLVDAGFRVIRFDNRDIGLSTKMPDEPPTIPRLLRALAAPRRATAPYLLSDLADDTAGLLDHLEIERAHIVGMSMGGMIAQSLTIRHPRRVASLTSIMSNTGDRRHGRIHLSLWPRARQLRTRSRDEFVDRGVEMFSYTAGPHFDADAVRAQLEESLARNYDVDGTRRQTMAIAASPDRTADLEHVTAPTLVIHGLVDPLVLPSGGIATAKAIPGSRLLTFPDMGHDLPRPRWGEMIEAIVDNAERGGFKRRT